MKRIALTILLLIAGWFTFTEFVNVAVCDGWYDLVVDVSPEISSDIDSIAFVGASSSDMATSYTRAINEMLPSFDKSESTDSLTLNVGFSYRDSGLLGRTWGHVQEYSHVVVVLQRSDGTQDIYIAPVPHRDDSKHIVVTAACAA